MALFSYTNSTLLSATNERKNEKKRKEKKRKQKKKAHCYVTLGHVKTRFTLYPNELQI